ncbi:sensor histidine kinase [Desulforhopalus sp. IMCC35007]|uniref:ATP-binding protein n=1 Tax=Desulforhopalus sp. IMCC35007 TaxID=2569543 RepID=UPI0010AE9835|nr:sensor histidine kinase [Desulforhopalus sp. IMCC35007]TKB11817.1 sensor histidine kinase [Desulforhopalus sp. IMCC35007]
MKTAVINLYQSFRPKRLLDSVTIIIMVLVVALLVSIGTIFSQLTFDIVDKQTQKRAIQTAKQIAGLLEREDFINTPRDLYSIAAFNDIIEMQTDVEDIIVTNRDGIIISHPDPQRIGTINSDPLAIRALKYGSDYSKRIVENGRQFIRGSVPLLEHNYRIIGMVSAGYPVESMRKVSDAYLEKIIFFIFVFITLGLVAAIFIAKGVKWVIFGLEPSEIAYMFQERSALLESIREGIISTGPDGRIKLVNEAAIKTLNLHNRKELEGNHLSYLFPDLDATHILTTGEPVSDREFILSGIPIIVNAEPVGNKHGLVVTFRKTKEIDIIARELSQVQTFSDMLRAQTHEYSNSLHTIVGLLQIGAYEDALDFIADETKGHRKLIRFLAENLPDRLLSSMIIGKCMYASEQKVELIIDPESRMIDLPDQLDRHTLTTVLGNVINNAIEAAVAGKAQPKVTIFMSDFGNDLIFEIEDSGDGIEEQLFERIFEKGVSTKGGGQRGYGLYLAKKAINTLGGTIEVEKGDEGGTRFEIIIAKKRYGS